MQTLDDGRHPTRVGRRITGCRHAAELRDRVRDSSAAILLAELADSECGWLLNLDAEAVDRYGLPAGTKAAVYWTDGADNDPETDLRALDSSDTALLCRQCQSVLVDKVIDHYRNVPEDDGHPAYALYRQYADRAAAEAAQDKPGANALART